MFDEAAGGWIDDLYSTEIITHEPNEAESVQGVLVGCVDHTLRKMIPSGTETAVMGKILTPAIGGAGWMQLQEVTVEYSSSALVTLSSLAADSDNGSYGAIDISLPATGGLPAKTKFIVSTNKWKLMWWQFSSADPTFRIFTEGFAVRVKDWGKKDPFRQMNPFEAVNPYFPSKGGFGGEN